MDDKLKKWNRRQSSVGMVGDLFSTADHKRRTLLALFVDLHDAWTNLVGFPVVVVCGRGGGVSAKFQDLLISYYPSTTTPFYYAPPTTQLPHPTCW